MNNLPATTAQSVIETIKAIVPRSFEKAFANTADTAIVAGMQICISDLNPEQINTGLMAVVNKGFCPDPALFRRWCLGLDGFDSTDYIADSYIGKSGALANIKRWLCDKNAPISQAEKQAYNATYELFEQVSHANNAEFVQSQADSAFKDHYEMIVREAVANKIPSQRYVPPVAISHQGRATPTDKPHQVASQAFVEALFAKHGLGRGRMLKGVNKMEALA